MIVDLNAGDNPYSAWTDEVDEHFSNAGHSRVGTYKGLNSLRFNWSDWLCDVIASVFVGSWG